MVLVDFSAASVIAADRAEDLARNGTITAGTVERVHKGEFLEDDTLTVRFNAAGRQRHATIHLNRSSSSYRRGQGVEVIFDPDDPTRVRTTQESNDAPSGPTTAALFLWPILIATGVVTLIRSHRRRRILARYPWRLGQVRLADGDGRTSALLDEPLAPDAPTLVRLRPARLLRRGQSRLRDGQVWMAGDLGSRVVVSPPGGGALFDVRRPRTDAQRRRWSQEHTREAGRPGPSLGFMIRWALLVLLGSAAAGAAVGGLAIAVPPHSTLAAIVASYAGLYGVMLWACRRFSRRFGTGRLTADLGVRFQPADIGRGFLLAIAALILEAIVVAPLRNTRFAGTNTGTLHHFRHGLAGYAVLAVVVVMVAPFMEELFFRGVLLRGFTASVGPVLATVGQVLLFGLVHVSPYSGAGNVGVVLGVMAIGLVLGWAALRYRRLGPGMVAHGLINLVAVIAIATR